MDFNKLFYDDHKPDLLPDKEEGKLFRIDAEQTTNSVCLRLRKFPIVKTTPKGFWISQYEHYLSTDRKDMRFVLSDAHKRFACLSKADALESFLRRKLRQQAILNAQLKTIARAIEIANEMIAEANSETSDDSFD